MLRWAQKSLPDKRTVPVSELRVMKSFRFKKETLEILKEIAQKAGKTETQNC